MIAIKLKPMKVWPQFRPLREWPLNVPEGDCPLNANWQLSALPTVQTPTAVPSESAPLIAICARAAGSQLLKSLVRTSCWRASNCPAPTWHEFPTVQHEP